MPGEQPSSGDTNIPDANENKITFGNKVPDKTPGPVTSSYNAWDDETEAASQSGFDRRTIGWIALGVVAVVIILAAGIYFMQGSDEEAAAATASPVAGAVVDTSTPTSPTAPLPTSTATDIQTSEPSPTQTPVSVPTETPAPVVVPSQTPASLPEPTAAPPPIPVVAPALSSPVSGAGTVGDLISFAWQWDGELQPEEYFEVRIWHEATPNEQQVIGWVQVPQFDYNIGGQRAGNYFWTVVIIKGKNPVQKEWTLQPDWPYPIWEGEIVRELSPEAEPRIFYYVP